MEKIFYLSKEQIVELVPNMGGCMATDKITVEGKKIRYMYREAPENESDSGWRFFSGGESQAYNDDPKNISIHDVNTIANYDRDIIPFLQEPYPCAFERNSAQEPFAKVEDEDS